MRTNGSKPGWPRLFPPTYLKDKECRAREWGAGLRGGGFGALWRLFGRFFGFFRAPGQKAKDPLPRELNPRLPLYLTGDMTATPGPRLCCRGTTPEPPGSGFGGIIRSSFLSGADSARLAAKSGPCWVTVRPSRIRARAKVGRIRGKKRALRELGSARGPLRGK